MDGLSRLVRRRTAQYDMTGLMCRVLVWLKINGQTPKGAVRNPSPPCSTCRRAIRSLSPVSSASPRAGLTRGAPMSMASTLAPRSAEGNIPPMGFADPVRSALRRNRNPGSGGTGMRLAGAEGAGPRHPQEGRRRPDWQGPPCATTGPQRALRSAFARAGGSGSGPALRPACPGSGSRPCRAGLPGRPESPRTTGNPFPTLKDADHQDPVRKFVIRQRTAVDVPRPCIAAIDSCRGQIRASLRRDSRARSASSLRGIDSVSCRRWPWPCNPPQPSHRCDTRQDIVQAIPGSLFVRPCHAGFLTDLIKVCRVRLFGLSAESIGAIECRAIPVGTPLPVLRQPRR